MGSKRDYYRYELRNGHKIVYIGITNDPERRETEHENASEDFTSMNVIRPVVTEDSARGWEQQRLETYRQGHNGQLPPYNERGG